MQTIYKTERFNCPHCDKPLEGAQSGVPNPGRPPLPGDKAACIACGSVIFFDTDGFRLGTQGDLDNMPAFIRHAFEASVGGALVARLPDKQRSIKISSVNQDAVLAGLALVSLSQKQPLAQRLAFYSIVFRNLAVNMSEEDRQRLLAYEPKPCKDAECGCQKREAATVECLKAFGALEPKKETF